MVDGGDLDIDFAAYDTKSKRVAKNVKESYGSHSIPVKEDGVFKFCFSNKMRLVSKYLLSTSFSTVYNSLSLCGLKVDLNPLAPCFAPNPARREGGLQSSTLPRICGPHRVQTPCSS